MKVLAIISLVFVCAALIVKYFEQHQQQVAYLKATKLNEEFRKRELKNAKTGK
jgi:L-asparagine transporter-like permease|tara:strand:+ start:2206 stop:2364 length:159 start_codon:yes stop_codon:yes gene_type:complete